MRRRAKRFCCTQVSTYLPDWLPSDTIYQPSVPRTEDLAVLMDGDEDVDMEVLRSKGECLVLGGYRQPCCTDGWGQGRECGGAEEKG
jgi:hypothetical protein